MHLKRNVVSIILKVILHSKLLFHHIRLFSIKSYQSKIDSSIPPRSGPPKDPDPPCFNFSAFSELILWNKDKMTHQKQPNMNATVNGTRPMVRSAGNSGACSATNGTGQMKRMMEMETKQKKLIKQIINQGIRSHRVQQVPPVHIMTRSRFAKIEYL